MMNYTPLSKVTTVLFVVALVVLLAVLPATAGTITSNEISKTAGSSTEGAGSAGGYSAYGVGDESLIYESGVVVDQVGKGTSTSSVPTTILDPSPIVDVNVVITDMTATGTVAGKDKTVMTGEVMAGSNVTVMSGYTPDDDIVNLTGVSVSAEISSYATAETGTKGTSASASSQASAVITANADYLNANSENYVLDVDLDGSTDACAAVTKKSSSAESNSWINAGAGTSDMTEIENYAFAGMGAFSEVYLGTGDADASASGEASALGQYYSGDVVTAETPFTVTNIVSVDGTVLTDAFGQNLAAGNTVWSYANIEGYSHMDNPASDYETISDFDAITMSYAYGSSNKFVGTAFADAYGTGAVQTTYADDFVSEDEQFLYNQSVSADFNLDADVTTAEGPGETSAESGIDVTAEYDPDLSEIHSFDQTMLDVSAMDHTDTWMWAETYSSSDGTKYKGTAYASAEADTSAYINWFEALPDDALELSDTYTITSGIDGYTDSYSTATNLAEAWDESQAGAYSAYGWADQDVKGVFGDEPFFDYEENVTFYADMLTMSGMSSDAEAYTWGSKGTASTEGYVDGVVGAEGTEEYLTSDVAVDYNELGTSNVLIAGTVINNASASKGDSDGDSLAMIGALEICDFEAYLNTPNEEYYLADDSDLAVTRAIVDVDGWGDNAKAAATVILTPDTGTNSGVQAWGTQDDYNGIDYDDHYIANAATVGTLTSTVSNVYGESDASAAAGAFTLTGYEYYTEPVDGTLISTSGSGMMTDSYAESWATKAKVTANSAVDDVSTYGSGFVEYYEQETGNDVNPMLHSYSLLSADATNTATAAGHKSGTDYESHAFNFGFGLDTAGWNETAGIFATGVTGLASETEVYGPVQAHAETNYVDLNNLAVASSLDADNQEAMAENYYTNAHTYADVNAKTLKAKTIAGWGTKSQTALDNDPMAYSTIRFGDATSDTWHVTGTHGWAFATLEGSTTSDMNYINPVLDPDGLVFVNTI